MDTLELTRRSLDLPSDYPSASEIVLNSPFHSFWLLGAIRDLAARDPLDAVRDAEILCALMQQRCREVVGL